MLPTLCYPPKEEFLNAIKGLAPQEIKCIIIGQDPYHGPGQANGLAFSVTPETKVPPSLKNIFQGILQDLGLPILKSGDLTAWKNSGVLLLNTALSVDAIVRLVRTQKKAGSNSLLPS
jgi:uracil-DNA glycosylase